MSKKILFLTPQLPFPPVSGGTIKSWKLIEFLSGEYGVFAAYFLKGDDRMHEEEFLNNVSLEGHYSEEIDVVRNAANFIKSNLLGISLNLYRNRSASFRRKIDEMAGACSVIFVDHYEMFQYVPPKYAGKVILHQHNCEYLIWDRFAAVETSFARRMALKNQAWRIKNYERRICNNSDRVLAAPNDIEELKRIGANGTTYMETYHLGEESLLERPDLEWGRTENALMFVGTLTWEANVDGIIWFLSEGWGLLRQRHPGLKLYIIGKNPDPRIAKLAAGMGGDVVLTGFVEDLDDYFTRCRAFISPLRFGSGIKVKVMNAMYRGIPTVTTSVGAEGMAVENRRHMMISDSMPDFLDSIDDLLSDEGLWLKLRDNSRALARQKYTWGAVLDIVRTAVEE